MENRLLLVGLGNPGARYAANRHNIGFMAIDAVAAAYELLPWRRRFHGEIAAGRIDREAVLALKPLTFMNDSGRSVAAAAQFYKLAAEQVIVFHDELDLAEGKVRIKRGGGHAGHNGLKSLDAHIGPGYRRVRLGIGHPGEKHKVLGHVLADFSDADEAWLKPLLAALARHLPLLLAGDDGQFMSKLALAVKPPPGPPSASAQSRAEDGDGL
jgi:PTH1 family peptidyl-tRNA hydrolase